MATRPVGEKRGPKIGDAASLWNFTPSPGWTKEEAHLLKLCLMKFGIGRWVQILDTGLLPGKLIQQLNGQTQRLLGQQSLAAYTGLQVDIDRIRADNEARTDAPRKAGLIINTGPNLTKEVKEKMQEEARQKYGLCSEQIKEAEEQLEEVAAAAHASVGISEEAAALLSAEPSTLSKEDKVILLRALHTRLEKLHSAFAKETSKPPRAPTAATTKGTKGAIQPSTSSDQENNGGPNTNQRSGVAGWKKRKSTGSGRGSSRQKNMLVDSDSEDGMDDGGMDDENAGINKAGGINEGENSDVLEAARAADVGMLISMGFGERQAQDALEEADGSLEMAAEWLMTHCV